MCIHCSGGGETDNNNIWTKKKKVIFMKIKVAQNCHLSWLCQGANTLVCPDETFFFIFSAAIEALDLNTKQVRFVSEKVSAPPPTIHHVIP